MTTATPRTTPRKKKNQFIFYLRISQITRSVHYAYRCQNLLKFDSLMPAFKFQNKIRKISRRRLRSPKYPELCHFTLLFCRGRLRNLQKITCTAIVLLIKPFVLWRSCCRRRRTLLKVPIKYFRTPNSV